jgi:multimeric flavodoxin WrbA
MIDVLNQTDAILLGSPTHIGNVAAQFKAFADPARGKSPFQPTLTNLGNIEKSDFFEKIRFLGRS